MRLWHKELIDVLPNKQLKGQWRECCAIAKAIKENGTPGHLLVNKIMDYPISHFINYAKLVDRELDDRGIGHRFGAFAQYFSLPELIEKVPFDEIFKYWHNEDYAVICQYNLYEKWLCGGIADGDYREIEARIDAILNRWFGRCKQNGGIANDGV